MAGSRSLPAKCFQNNTSTIKGSAWWPSNIFQMFSPYVMQVLLIPPRNFNDVLLCPVAKNVFSYLRYSNLGRINFWFCIFADNTPAKDIKNYFMMLGTFHSWFILWRKEEMWHLQVASKSDPATAINSPIADCLLIANPKKKITTFFSFAFVFWTQESGEGKGFTRYIGAGVSHVSEGDHQQQSLKITVTAGAVWLWSRIQPEASRPEASRYWCIRSSAWYASMQMSAG